MKVTILGCGAAPGVPSVSDGWGACDAANHRNRRQRTSILVEEGATRLLIDTSPDLRQQLLDAEIRRLDGVIYTHAHADHIHGIDELRGVNRAMGGPLAVYATAETLKVLQLRFGYAFAGIPPGASIFRPWLLPTEIASDQPFRIGDITIQPFVQDHGNTTTIGYRFGDLVYSTDVLELPAAARDVIRGAKLWILGAYGLEPHPTHVHVPKAVDWIEELQAERAVITHMSNAIDYETLRASLPVHIVPAYDGMTLET